MDQHQQPDHYAFMAMLTAKMARFMNELTQFCIANLPNADFNCLHKKNEQESSESEKDMNLTAIKTEEQGKRTYFKVKNKLPIQTDDERPKAPTSSFLIYYHENKVEFAKKFKQTNVSILTKLVAEEWKKLPLEERAKYIKMSQQSKQRYQKQMQTYKAKYADQIEEAMKKRRAQYRINWINKKKAKSQNKVINQRQDLIKKQPLFQHQ